MTDPCDVGRCTRDATVEVRFPQSGTYRYCARHGAVYAQYATPIRRTA